MRLFLPLSILAAVILVHHGSNGQSMANGDTVILIKPEEMRIIPKSLLERKLAFETTQAAKEKAEERRHEEFVEPHAKERKEKVEEKEPETFVKEEEEEEEEEETKRREAERKKKAEEKMFKSYVAVGVVRLIFDNTTEPFTLFYDGETGRSRVDLGSKGLVRTLQLSKLNCMYRIEFANRELVSPTAHNICIEMRGSHDKPVKALKGVPDLNRFERVGEDQLGNLKVIRWKLELKDEQKNWLYTFFMFTEPETKKPIRMEVFTKSLKSNKILDHYQIDYKYFFSTRPSDDIFLKPADIECRSITGLSLSDEEKKEEQVHREEGRLTKRPEIDKKRHHMNPFANLIDPDQHLSYDRELDKLFEGFRRLYNKHYNETDIEMRRAAFCHNYRYVNLVNRAGLSYRLRLNHLADRTNDELRKMLGVRNVGNKLSPENHHGVTFDSNTHNIRSLDRLPKSIDWRLFGAVTPVVNQGECGSDWAIAAKNVIESALFLRSNRLVKLSPQELIDCGHETGNEACNFGTTWQAYEYVWKNGIASEIIYGPYSFRKNECRLNPFIPTSVFQRYYK